MMAHSKMPPGLLFGVLVALLQSVFTQNNPNDIYIFNKMHVIVFLGPTNAGSGPAAWCWTSHSGQGIQQLIGLQRDNSGRWMQHSNPEFRHFELFQDMKCDDGTVHLRIRRLTFKFAGSLILAQTSPSYKILKQYEIFGIKIEASPHEPVMGSDVTLSCTISRLSDTISLHWRPMDSSQQNKTNTDQICLNNTVYLMIRYVTVQDGMMYNCEVQKNVKVVGKGKAEFAVKNSLYGASYTLYRTGTDGSELHLLCYSITTNYENAAWSWTSHLLPGSTEEIATAVTFQPITVTSSRFVNRLEPSVTEFNSNNLTMRISPVVFEDAGVYTCTLGGITFVTMTLITVKVTAEPSDAVTDGGKVTLTCSVSHVTELVRLVWINVDGKTVEEKTLNGEDKSLSLVIQKAERGKGNWRCGLFQQERLQILVPYNLEFSNTYTYIIITIIGSLALLLIVILGVVLCLKKCKNKGLENQRQKPQQIEGNTEEASHLYSNAMEIQKMQGNKAPVPETSNPAEYMSVDRKAKQEGNEAPVPETNNPAECMSVDRKAKQEGNKEDIHYGSISFENNESGSTHDMQCSGNSSGVNKAASNEDNLVIYAQISQTTYE
ncbi:uncharacterized protein LOC129701489 isoform X1 [Leucoraja erinacea]|uniref:uncharacterized protein LOC129701489 isoform X1 n=1 Tax=Leucoraja erinaceus TaxID=7782 RepID=UPI002456B363|nr:uncharacterized protein LOC129701489 isoform X1 [Leucoraja erinacea]